MSSSSTSAAAAESLASSLVVGGWILGSVASSVLIILVNKAVFQTYHFNYVFTLTSLHFLVTSLGMEVMAIMGMFPRKRLPLSDSIWMALFCIGSVAFMNFSLQYNTVSFYQVTKLLCIPMMVLIQILIYRQHFERKIQWTLAVVLLGVGLATVTDVQLNAIGLFMSACAVLFTAQFQIWQGEKQTTHGLNAMQMNHAQSMPSFLVCAILAYIFDVVGITSYSSSSGVDPSFVPVTLHSFTQPEVTAIFVSCVLALSVNLCTYGLIGKTSAVTYQVVGHAKTCLILLSGFLFFTPTTQPTASEMMKNLAGIALALAGVILYSQLKLVESQNKSVVDANSKASGQKAMPMHLDWCDQYTPRVVASVLGLKLQSPYAASNEYKTVQLEEGLLEPIEDTSAVPSASSESNGK